MKTVRIDKFLWGVRLFKTRTLATHATKNNKVFLNGEPVKPSKEVKAGDIIEVRKDNITRKFKVLEILKNRVGAKLVPDYCEDITEPAELEKLEALRIRLVHQRSKGLGRPTKKDRRDMEEFIDDWSDWDELDD